MDGPIENARTAVMKWIVPVRHPYILNVTINTVFHPGDNGQLGYWVSTVGSKLGRLVDFWPKLNILQGNYCILWIDIMPIFPQTIFMARIIYEYDFR